MRVCPDCERKNPQEKAEGLDTRPRKWVMTPEMVCPKCGQAEAYQYVGLLVHDLRRSAAKRMVLRGISERMAMKTGGWSTRTIFERYAIESEADLRDVADKLSRQEPAKLAT